MHILNKLKSYNLRPLFKNYSHQKHGYKNLEIKYNQIHLMMDTSACIATELSPKKSNGWSNYFSKIFIWFASGVTIGTYFNIKVSCNELRSKDAKTIIKHADILYEKLEFEELHRFLVSEKESDDDEILWRLARSLYEIARKTKNNNEVKELYTQALNCLQKAEKINPNNFAIHKWLAIIMDCHYTLEGLKSRISHLYEMRSHMEKACQLKPEDGTSWHVLGMWYFGVSNISWYERKAAALFFATPPESSYEEALKMFKEAERVEPGFYSKNFLMIGKCLFHIGKKEESVDYFLKAKNYNGNTVDDKEAKDEAVKWLRLLGKL